MDPGQKQPEDNPQDPAEPQDEQFAIYRFLEGLSDSLNSFIKLWYTITLFEWYVVIRTCCWIRNQIASVFGADPVEFISFLVFYEQVNEFFLRTRDDTAPRNREEIQINLPPVDETARNQPSTSAEEVEKGVQPMHTPTDTPHQHDNLEPESIHQEKQNLPSTSDEEITSENQCEDGREEKASYSLDD